MKHLQKSHNEKESMILDLYAYVQVHYARILRTNPRNDIRLSKLDYEENIIVKIEQFREIRDTLNGILYEGLEEIKNETIKSEKKTLAKQISGFMEDFVICTIKDISEDIGEDYHHIIRAIKHLTDFV